MLNLARFFPLFNVNEQFYVSVSLQKGGELLEKFLSKKQMIDSYPEDEVRTTEPKEVFENEFLPEIDYEIPQNDILVGSMEVIRRFFPLWTANEIKCSICTAGLTNKLVKVEHKSATVLVRIYGLGTHVLIDRKQELSNMVRLSQLGFFPGIYGVFGNGMVYGYVHGCVYTPADMVDAHKSFLVAEHMASWHQINTRGDKPQLFVTLQKWLELLPFQYSADTKNRLFSTFGYTIDSLRKESVYLQRKLEAIDSPVVFCHNDIQVGNIVYDAENDAVRFIDYEYGCVSYRGFDIGNHFCEFGGTNGDWTKYPRREFQLQWFHNYLLSSGQDPTPSLLETMYREVNAFSLASHFLWAIWALIQAEISDIEFDYLNYAHSRLQEYYKNRDTWLQ
jgi:ethanolamine kinase